MAATATPVESKIAANPINKWRREMFLSDFMVVFPIHSLFVEEWEISPRKSRLSIMERLQENTGPRDDGDERSPPLRGQYTVLGRDR
jgi:hypothetical protein